MKKRIPITLLFVFVIMSSQTRAQGLIAVQNGNSPKFFQQVDDAITNSADGDTIYIPGGTWNIGQQINKRLHLIGVGYHPDSTKVTFPTTLNGIVTLAAGADDASFTGIYLKSGLISLEGINSITVSRCRISEHLSFSTFDANFSFNENIIECTIYGNSTNESATNFSFLNNIISSSFYTDGVFPPFINSSIKNNIFYGSPYTQYSLFENNIFMNSAYFSMVTNSSAKNNLFVLENPFQYAPTDGFYNNIVAQDQNSIFINITGAIYTNDYHLQATCPGKNAGTDGTDIGIYGGIYPWKAGSVPANPHFQSLKISPTTDTNGNINVKIKVAAQDH